MCWCQQCQLDGEGIRMTLYGRDKYGRMFAPELEKCGTRLALKNGRLLGNQR